MRVVLDTNVLVSALLKRHGNEALVLTATLAGKFELIVSPAVLAEYELVLPRPWFGFSPAEVRATLTALRHAGRLVRPTQAIAKSPDESDNRLLECAETGRDDGARSIYVRTFLSSYQSLCNDDPSHRRQRVQRQWWPQPGQHPPVENVFHAIPHPSKNGSGVPPQLQHQRLETKGRAEPTAQTSSDPAANHRACVGMCGDGVSAALDVRDERCAKARLLLLVVLGRVVELAFGQLMKGADHSREPGFRVLEHCCCGSSGAAVGVPRRGPTLGLFAPELRVFFIR